MKLAGALVAIVVVAGSVVGACERDALIGVDGASPGGTRVADDAGAVGTRGCHQAKCAGHTYACGDCIDNDGDGMIDQDDPDCLGPCQNLEDSFLGAIPGQGRQTCAEDCYFDDDNGFGNDDCLWSRECDPLSVPPEDPTGSAACAYDPNAKLPENARCGDLQAAQSARCLSVCLPVTPNGCDCFGCCSIPGAKAPVWLGSVDASGRATCDLAHAGDPSRCEPCTQVAACLNPCETCELCIGKASLPASCTTSAPGTDCAPPVCSRGAPCGLDCLPACPDGQACITGCCVSALE